jgi:Tol biopolymer transport system component
VVDRESEETPFNISVVSLETGQKRRLVSPAVPSPGVMGLAVSPDGQTVAFSQIIVHRAGLWRTQCDLYTVSILGGESRRLTFDNVLIVGLTWFPDGREIVFASHRERPTALLFLTPSGEFQPLADSQKDCLLPRNSPSTPATQPSLGREIAWSVNNGK